MSAPAEDDLERTVSYEEASFENERRTLLPVDSERVINVSSFDRERIKRKILWRYRLNPRSHQRRENFNQNPKEGAEHAEIALKEVLRSDQIARIEGLYAEANGSFLLIRNVLPVRWDFPKTVRAYRLEAGDWAAEVNTRRRRQMRTIDCVLGGLLSLAGYPPWYRFNNIHKCAWDLTTHWSVQETPDSIIPDMPLRFHQSAVEKQLVTQAQKTGDAAGMIVFGAIRNPRRIPILLLSLPDILSELEKIVKNKGEYDRILQNLQDRNFVCEAPRLTRHVYSQNAMLDSEPILFKKPRGFISSFDSALIWPMQGKGHSAGVEAVDYFRKAIEQASLTRTVGIRLRRHDVLLVNNLTAFVARAEEKPKVIDPGALFPRRWIRKMYGFPKAS